MLQPTNKAMPRYANGYTSAASCLLPWTVMPPLLLLLHLRVVAHAPRPIRKASLRRVHQNSLQSSYPPSRGVSINAAGRYDRLQHRVHSILRNRFHHFTHSPVLASGGSECGGLPVHDLDGTRLSHPLHKFYYMEREYYELGASVV